jgi:hypothetical protein
MFNLVTVEVLSRTCSDHSPILVSISSSKELLLKKWFGRSVIFSNMRQHGPRVRSRERLSGKLGGLSRIRNPPGLLSRRICKIAKKL